MIIRDWTEPLDDSVFRFIQHQRVLSPEPQSQSDAVKFPGFTPEIWRAIRANGRKLSPMRNLDATLVKKLESNPRVDWNALARIRRYCKLALTHASEMSDKTRACLMLYLEEFHTAERTLPCHRHVLSLNEANELSKNINNISHDAGLVQCCRDDRHCPRGIAREETARRRMREFTRIDDIDARIGDWSNLYITGDCIDYCCNQGLPIDFLDMVGRTLEFILDVPADQFRDRADAIRKLPFHRKVIIRMGAFGEVCNNALASTRGWYQNGRFWLTFSAMMIYSTARVSEYKNGSSKTIVHDYLQRGYIARISQRDKGDWKSPERPIDLVYHDSKRMAPQEKAVLECATVYLATFESDSNSPSFHRTARWPIHASQTSVDGLHLAIHAAMQRGIAKQPPIVAGQHILRLCDLPPSKSHAFVSSNEARERFNRITRGILDKIDWTDVYATGNSIVRCVISGGPILYSAHSLSRRPTIELISPPDRVQDIADTIRREVSAVFIGALLLAPSCHIRFISADLSTHLRARAQEERIWYQDGEFMFCLAARPMPAKNTHAITGPYVMPLVNLNWNIMPGMRAIDFGYRREYQFGHKVRGGGDVLFFTGDSSIRPSLYVFAYRVDGVDAELDDGPPIAYSEKCKPWLSVFHNRLDLIGISFKHVVSINVYRQLPKHASVIEWVIFIPR